MFLPFSSCQSNRFTVPLYGQICIEILYTIHIAYESVSVTVKKLSVKNRKKPGVASFLSDTVVIGCFGFFCLGSGHLQPLPIRLPHRVLKKPYWRYTSFRIDCVKIGHLGSFCLGFRMSSTSHRTEFTTSTLHHYYISFHCRRADHEDRRRTQASVDSVIPTIFVPVPEI